MTQEEIQLHCKRITSAGGTAHCVFTLAEPLGFIDTSPEQNGSRGVAFFENKMTLNQDGEPFDIPYADIRSLQIIDSFEDSYADELNICTEYSECRISDCSLEKSELKSLIEELCKYKPENQEPREISPAPIPEEKIDWISENNEFSETVKAEKSVAVAEKPIAIPEDKIDWISQSVSAVANSDNEGITGTVLQDRPTMSDIAENFEPVSESPIVQPAAEENLEAVGKDEPRIENGHNLKNFPETAEPFIDDDDLFDNEMREAIENMSHEETLDYLSKTLNAINSSSGNAVVTDEMLMSETAPHPEPPAENPSEQSNKNLRLVPPPIPEATKPKGLTVEPVWGDIYIKASRSLRELCEEGKLTMEQIERELKDKLLDSAKAFAEIISDESRIPKVLIPKITELKNASDHFDRYFEYGEDIAQRAMFFMLFQMLSYSDRIVEAPDTKERLNDFFRRFGPAGITLSMLDTRI